jgi:DNA-binding beta-propeller fold protein YncE
MDPLLAQSRHHQTERFAMTRSVLIAMLLVLPVTAAPPERTLSFTKLWTHGHTTAGQVSEIPAFDRRTNTIWVAGVVGVDVLDGSTGTRIEHIDVTGYGLVNSVAIHNGLAALAIEAGPPDRRRPGVVVFYDTRTRLPIGDPVTVGSLPDMLTFTHDGSKLLVANEGTPNAVADTAYTAPDPPGSVSIIDVETRAVIATAGFENVPRFGANLRTNVGMDFEPEYIAIEKDGSRAFVTLQEANAIAVLDLSLNAFTGIIGLGAKDFSLPGNEFDPKDNDGTVAFINANAKGLYMPDGVASYQWRGRTFLVLANEGDFREDNADRAAAGSAPYFAAAPLDRLRISNADSSPGDLYAAGARSMSIRDVDGTVVYDSGRILDSEAHKRGVYDNGRSRDKGVEPEGVALLDVRGRTYAFVGLERTTSSTVAVFDVTNPYESRFLDMIVTPGDLSPEGLAAFEFRGDFYLAIANEVPASGTTTANTTLYRVDPARH